MDPNLQTMETLFCSSGESAIAEPHTQVLIFNAVSMATIWGCYWLSEVSLEHSRAGCTAADYDGSQTSSIHSYPIESTSEFEHTAP